jgi:uncharacterized membrane protein
MVEFKYFIMLESIDLDINYWVKILTDIAINFCQILAIFIVAIGVIRGLIIFLKELLFKPQSPEAFQRSRLAMGYSFSLGLSCLVGASILNTIVSSRWGDIARLAMIIAVRAALNYLLIQAIETGNDRADKPQKI